MPNSQVFDFLKRQVLENKEVQNANTTVKPMYCTMIQVFYFLGACRNYLPFPTILATIR